MKYALLLTLTMLSSYSIADGFASGVPVAIQKTDYFDLHLLFITLDSPISTASNCDSTTGLIVHDSNDSSTAALSLAMTALATGKKFQCYIRTNSCSRVNGALTTYPVCEYYPALVN